MRCCRPARFFRRGGGQFICRQRRERDECECGGAEWLNSSNFWKLGGNNVAADNFLAAPIISRWNPGE